MSQDPRHHLLQRALLLEDDAGQVEQDLVPLHLQQGPLVQLGVPEAETTELQIFLKDSAVVLTEVALVVLVYHLDRTSL